MALSLYDASIPVFLHFLRNLSTFLDRSEAHAAANDIDLSIFTDARLIEDMHPLTRQIQIASDGAKGGGARLAGIEAPSFPDVETTFPELKERLAKTIAFLETIQPEQVNGKEDAVIELKFPGQTLTFTGQTFLLQFALPNFMFHVVTAYALMRSKGAPLGKMDFLSGATPR